ncbi:MAG: 50S ribosomal protein L25 [Patescibacteria group bacterium]
MDFKLTAQKRERNEKLSPEFIPAVLYGKGVENQSLKIKKVEFDKAFKAAGESNLIDLDFGQGAVKVLVKDTQHDVMKGFFTHVDFYQVNMKEKITTEIPLHFVGESKAVKELGGVLIKDMIHLTVECLPSDLVDHIDVDISVLKTFSDAIRVNDLSLAKGLSLVHHTNEMVAAVKEPKVEEEPVAVEAAPAAEGAAGEATAKGAAPAAEANKEGGKK